METRKRISAKDIARETDLSVNTVYSVLKNEGRISKETSKRVLETAHRMGYRTNQNASSLSRKKAKKICVMFPTKATEFFDEVERGVDFAAQKYSDYGLEVHKIRTESFDVDKQILQLMKIIEDGADGIAISPAHQIYLNEMINKAVESGIYVGTFNTDAPGSLRFANVQDDSMASGRLGAELIGKMIGGAGKVLIISAFPDLFQCQQRIRGVEIEMAKSFPAVELLGPVTCFDNEELQYLLTLDALEQNPDIKAIFIDNAVVFGAAKAIVERGLTSKVKLVGYDLSERSRDLLKNDVLQALLYQDPFKQGSRIVELLFERITNKHLSGVVIENIRPSILLRNNIGAYASEPAFP